MDLLVPKLEKQIGIGIYAAKSPGIGGVIRQRVDDFLVQEVLVDGSKVEIPPSNEYIALDASSAPNRYLLCVLVKRNWDTFSALKAIAAQVGVSAERIQIGGIKDAKAVTAQHITIEGASVEDVKKVQVKDIRIRPVGYVRQKLSSYYVLGNSFHVTISSINRSKATIINCLSQALGALKAIGGFPNFFGHQRFGTTRPITHLVGKAIVNGNFKKAAMLFLARSSLYEHPSSRQARQALRKSQDFQKALRDFPKQLRYERILLGHLVKKPGDYVGAFKHLPMKLQELFPQAYQAYLFNRFLTGRVQDGFPLNEAVIGDFVVSVERSGLPMQAMFKIVTAENRKETNTLLNTWKMRLALPLIGFKQRLSQGAQGEIERQILEKEGATGEQFRINAIPDISLRGGLRTTVSPIEDFSMGQVVRNSEGPSKYEARVSFTLYRSSYATIVLRELMKPRNPVKAGF
jgi:tRNA pseudouridine13 synthase